MTAKHVVKSLAVRRSVVTAAIALGVVFGLVSGVMADAGKKGSKSKIQRTVPRPTNLVGQQTYQAPITRPTVPTDSVTGPHAVIEVTEPTHDFGVKWIGPKFDHTFVIKNAGDKTLEISRVKPSCGCTVAGNYPRKIEPGQSGEFPFSIASTKLRGRFTKSITISSNDPVTPDLRLQLKGEVKRYVDVSPANANFGKIVGQAASTRILNITNNTDKPLNALVAPASDGQFTYEMVETEKGQKFELRVTANPPFKPGALKSNAVIKTNIDEQKEIKIVARATVPARLDLQPSVISLRPEKARSGAKGVSRVVRFTNYGPTEVKILSATIDDPSVTATVNERTPGKAYTVLLQFPKDYKVPAGGKTLTIKTDDKEQPTLAVRIQGPRTQTAKRRPAEELVGQSAPSFAVKTTDGKSVGNADFKDTVTILDFFAVNCGFCSKQIPRLETVRQKYEGKPVRFIAVAETMRKRPSDADVHAKLDTLGFKGERVLDLDNKIGPMFKATSFPTMVVIGKTGKVEAVNVGNVGDLESRVAGQVDALLAGRALPRIAAAPAKKPAERKDANSLIGKSAGAFTATTLGGKSMSSADFAKHPATILNFFAVNCGYCKKQIPRLETVRQKYEGKGIRFVNVSQKMRKEFSTEEVVKKMTDLGYKGEVVVDHTNTIGGKFFARGFPTMVVVGKDGKVGAVNVGNIGDLEKRLGDQLDAALAGKPFPKYATAKPKSRVRPAEGTVGKPAPSFSLTTLTGKSIGSDGFKNHPATVLNFVAPNCGFCKRQLPNVEKIRTTYEAKGVRFVNVSQTMRKEYSVEEAHGIFTKAGSGMEFAEDKGNAVGRSYKATSFPTMIVVGRDGKIANVNIGAKQNIDTLLSGQLDKLIAKK